MALNMVAVIVGPALIYMKSIETTTTTYIVLGTHTSHITATFTCTLFATKRDSPERLKINESEK